MLKLTGLHMHSVPSIGCINHQISPRTSSTLFNSTLRRSKQSTGRTNASAVAATPQMIQPESTRLELLTMTPGPFLLPCRSKWSGLCLNGSNSQSDYKPAWKLLLNLPFVGSPGTFIERLLLKTKLQRRYILKSTKLYCLLLRCKQTKNRFDFKTGNHAMSWLVGGLYAHVIDGRCS